MNPHQLVVAGQIWFALGAVGDHILNRLRILRLQLDISRKARAAQADHAGILNPLDDLLVRQLVRAHPLGIIGKRGEQPVVGDHNAFRQSAADHTALLDHLDRTGTAGMNRRGNKAVRFGKQLAHPDLIILFDDRFGRFTDMLAERENHLPFRIEKTQTAFPAQFLVPFGMHAAAKCVFHCSADSFHDWI